MASLADCAAVGTNPRIARRVDSDDMYLALNSMSIHQSIQTALTEADTLTLSGTLMNEARRGAGVATARLHHQNSEALFTEVRCSAGGARSACPGLGHQPARHAHAQGTLSVGDHQYAGIKAQRTLDAGWSVSGADGALSLCR